MNKAFIALGTNIEPRTSHLEQALKELEAHENLTIVSQSSIYETEPVGLLDQSNFLNMVIEIKTTLSPIELLEYCQSIEKGLGRKRTIRFGPRTIDLDILLYNQEVVEESRLTIPHPRMHERAFVLIPLKEVAPHVKVSTLGKSVQELAATLSEEDISGVVLAEQE